VTSLRKRDACRTLASWSRYGEPRLKEPGTSPHGLNPSGESRSDRLIDASDSRARRSLGFESKRTVDRAVGSGVFCYTRESDCKRQKLCCFVWSAPGVAQRFIRPPANTSKVHHRVNDEPRFEIGLSGPELPEVQAQSLSFPHERSVAA